jgi:hypothetical protein
LATPGSAFVCDAFLSLASSAQRLIFIGFDNVFFDIDTSPTTTLDRVADFVFACSVLAKPEYAFVPDVRLVLAQLGSHLVLNGSDNINFGIDTTLYYDYLDVSPSFFSDTMRLGFKYGYLDTSTRPRHRPTPRTATSTKVAAPTALGYVDIDTRAITLHEHSPASSTVQASGTQLCPRRSRSDCGGGGGVLRPFCITIL